MQNFKTKAVNKAVTGFDYFIRTKGSYLTFLAIFMTIFIGEITFFSLGRANDGVVIGDPGSGKVGLTICAGAVGSVTALYATLNSFNYRKNFFGLRVVATVCFITIDLMYFLGGDIVKNLMVCYFFYERKVYGGSQKEEKLVVYKIDERGKIKETGLGTCVALLLGVAMGGIGTINPAKANPYPYLDALQMVFVILGVYLIAKKPNKYGGFIFMISDGVFMLMMYHSGVGSTGTMSLIYFLFNVFTGLSGKQKEIPGDSDKVKI